MKTLSPVVIVYHKTLVIIFDYLFRHFSLSNLNVNHNKKAALTTL